MEYTELKMPQSGDSVLVAMSGGVDSTFAALMLLEAGCRVTGVTMAMRTPIVPCGMADCLKARAGHSGGRDAEPFLIKSRGRHPSCYSSNEAEDIAHIKEVCRKLGIKHIAADVRDIYRKEVIEYFKTEYKAGCTPNPCIRCNREVKFGAMLQAAKTAGAEYDYFCTGHYAKVVRTAEGIWGSGKRPALVAAGKDKRKDQSYFLCNVPSQVLETVRFPLGGMTKAEVRAAAREAGLEAADSEESQDFMGGEARSALFADMEQRAGNIVDEDGKVLGTHNGIEHYTVGQRRGLGVSSSEPLYVKEIDAASNTVVVCKESALLRRELEAVSALWPMGIVPPHPFEARVKIRLKSPAAQAIVEPCDSSFKVHFKEDVRAVAKGQSAVIYIGDAVFGAGIISR